jgi:hypothetical protein
VIEFHDRVLLPISSNIPSLLVSPVALCSAKSAANATTWFSFGILAISTLLLFMASFTLQEEEALI